MNLGAVIVHGGAGSIVSELAAARDAGCQRAADAAWEILESGGTALAAVIAAVVVLEDDPSFNAGRGSTLTRDGTVEMDASIMEGTRRAGGGVAVVTTVVNPILLAHAVMEDGRHVLLAADGAERFARERKLATTEPEYFVTPRQRERWRDAGPETSGTVGAVALDRRGRVAAATSTGGMMGKLPGRIGDSAIVGAGTFADDSAGAASATGHGESILLTGLTRRAVDLLRDGRDPGAVAASAIGELDREGGIIVLDRFGRAGWACNAAHMPVASRGGRRAGAAR